MKSGGARGALVDCLVISALWLATVFLIDPVGDFPLNDDWSFGLTVRHLLGTGDFRPNGWGAMTLLSNVLWGALFCVPAGFSFNALRASTLVLSIAGVLGFYWLIRDTRQPRWFAVAGALTLAANPIYCALSETFMTDVAFTALLIFSVLCLARNLRDGSRFGLIAGTLLALAAVLSRQIGLCVPLAFGFCILISRPASVRTVLYAVISPGICCAGLTVFQLWMSMTGRLPAAFNAPLHQLLHALSSPLLFLFYTATFTFPALLYLGLFLLPISLPVVASCWRAEARRMMGIFVFTVLILGFGIAALGSLGGNMLMPIRGNVLVRSGIGPVALRDMLLGLPHVPRLGAGFWLVVTMASYAGAGLLASALSVFAVRLGPSFRAARADAIVGVFALLAACIYLLPVLVAGFYDRYLIPTVPLLTLGILSLCGTLPQRTWAWRTAHRDASGPCAFALILLFAFFSVAATRDYLVWNRVRWQAMQTLMHDQRVRPGEVDAGFEVNGFYLYDAAYTAKPDKSWWWVDGDTYQIGFGPVPGYDVIRSYDYWCWLPPHVATLVVMKKKS